MSYILIPLIIILSIMAVVSLVRGIVAFLQSTKLDLENQSGSEVPEALLKQNRMMFARIKYQAAAVIVVALLLAISR